jgi:ABC-type protease/lipase transport system fused ATPase/permease subunit
VLPSRSVPTLVALLLLAAGMYAAQGVIDMIRSRILVRVGRSLDEALSSRVYDAVVRLPLKVGNRGEGTQPIRDLDTVRGFLSGIGPVAFFDLPWIPIYLAICFIFHFSLVVQNAAVTPPGAQKIVSQDINFTPTAGKALGVIGPTASGKSSLARMLVGVWSPVRGTVRLDGATIDQWSPEALGRHIGYVPQDVELFNGTVAQNISRFEEPPDPDAVIAAAQAAGVHDLITGLPEGYDTIVGDHGSALSAGQAPAARARPRALSRPFPRRA